MKVISREEWLKLSYFKRWRLVRYCKHPFEKSIRIGTVRNPDMDADDEYFFVAHVRQCCLCRDHFLDAGLTTKSRYKAHVDNNTIYASVHKVLHAPNSSKAAKTAAGSALSQPMRKGKQNG